MCIQPKSVFLKMSALLCLLLIFNTSLESPATNKSNSQTKASYYGKFFHGKKTSSGELYNKFDFTAAHKTFPFNTLLLVTNKVNGKSVVVRINDRGPFKKSRVIDLSYSAAQQLNMVRFGVVPVKIKELHLLDKKLIDSSIVKKENIWDCFGKKQVLKNNSVFVWQTENWKHAFYMGSNISLQLKLKSIVIKINKKKDSLQYQLIVSGIDTKENAEKIVTLLKNNGFVEAQIILQ